MKFWGECVLTATYPINRMPAPILKNKTPYELPHGQKPSYDHLRVFGCLCYVSTSKQGKDKFMGRVVPYVFLGYPYGKKAYKVMTFDTHKFHSSRDIVFHEAIFPFSSSAPTSSYDHLRVFGCLCYVSTSKQGKDKFMGRVVPCVFLGYPYGKKAYKVMTFDSHKFHSSRDIVFHEAVFPFSSSAPTSLSPINDEIPAHYQGDGPILGDLDSISSQSSQPT